MGDKTKQNSLAKNVYIYIRIYIHIYMLQLLLG